ncbi:major facilitator superfamily transporter [Sodiomyces alkalinus F11]|uniref:Major facilitator superfamily transporter n=1 Tax=Sodiomyces alkalinus (strain CBS 110278 / VKM F-3762 / F11) TaxID=1314773 RepID=A0A3N2Q377_SODAK|nr:major facilitator superfamily transporter [Sodiomyces alkalinus F11]ROT41223.1 major facilitator superfamily transporter [Sodiomyces alkalinus F11]
MLRFIHRRLFETPTESVDNYLGVAVPLEEAHWYSHSRRTGKTEFEERDLERPGDDDAADEEDNRLKDSGADETRGMLEMSAAEYTIAGLRKEVWSGRGDFTDYELKSKLINKAIQDIGMGKYNWQLFVLCGFGWFADNLWMQGVSLTLPSLSAEFDIPEKTVRYTTSALFIGLCFGSFFWGIGSDILGRRLAFNCTLLITSIFGLMTSWAPTWGATCFLYAALGFGVGGNLPVDGALFLEFLPDASSSLLTLLSVWWPVGQLVSSILAWYYIANWPADEGWRLFVFVVGLITLAMFAVRCFAFNLFESPKFLLSRGRQAEAIAVVHGIAYRNGTKTWLTEEVLNAVVGGTDTDADMMDADAERSLAVTKNALKDKLKNFSGARLRPLFQNKLLGLTTSLIWFCWTTIGMGYPLFNAFLPQYFARVSNPGGGGGGGGDGASPTPPEDGSVPALTPEIYRNYAITSVMGIPGALLAAYLVGHESPWLGRRGTLAISTFVSAIFLFLFVELGTTATAQLFFSCVEAFTQNIMYGVLYAFTPEIFPGPVRGAGTGVASFLNRIAGLMAPLIAANVPGDGTTAPVFISAALILAAFVAMCLIPIETRGRQRL